MAEPGDTLTPAEIAAFKRDGWFLRRDILDPELCARCRDLIWDTPGAHPPRMRREDRRTYVGPFRGGDDEEGFSGYRWFPRRDVLADDPAFVNVLPQCPRVKAIAEQLLGAGEVEEIHSSSGIYGTLPMGAKPKSPNSCHVDSYLDSRQRLSCVAYIDDVAPHGGSFMVWPGSHHKCHAFLTTAASGKRNGYAAAADEKQNLSGGPDRAPTWAAGMERAQRWCQGNIVPVDTWGRAGTAVFYHARLAHHASGNYSDNIRQAVLIRFAKTQEALPDRDCLEHARTNDVWRDWSPLVRETLTAGGEVTASDRASAVEGLRFTETGWFPVDGVETPWPVSQPAPPHETPPCEDLVATPRL
jgi:hypothetical protein